MQADQNVKISFYAQEKRLKAVECVRGIGVSITWTWQHVLELYFPQVLLIKHIATATHSKGDV